MKKVDLAPELITETEKALEDIEKEVFGKERVTRVKSGVRAGGCIPGSCPRPLYGVPI